MKIFIYATSRVARLLVSALDNMSKNSIEILVLKENHGEKDFVTQNVSVCLCDSLNNAISLCDVVIINNNHKMPLNKLKNIEEQVTASNKQLVTIDLTFDFYADKPRRIVANNSVPIIYNIGISDFLPTARLDYQLNNIFYKLKANCNQHFCGIAGQIISQLKNSSVLNDVLKFPVTSKNPYVRIWSCCYKDFPSFFHDNKTLPNPDIVFLTLPFKIRNYDDILKYLKFRYSCNTFLINNDYIDVAGDEHNTRFIYCSYQHGINSLNDIETYNKMIDFIKTNITFPSSINVII